MHLLVIKYESFMINKILISDISYNLTLFKAIFFSISVRPEKPVIKILQSGKAVDLEKQYLGPYQIGTSLSLVCQVDGGK